MGTLEDLLSRHKTVGIDTMIFIYHLENHPLYAPLTLRLFNALEDGCNAGVTSVITLLEILVKPRRDGNVRAAEDYTELLTSFPGLRMLDVDRGIADRAAKLRASYGIRTPDAIQIATAMKVSAGAFITNDKEIGRVAEIEVIMLEDFLS